VSSITATLYQPQAVAFYRPTQLLG